MNLAPAAGGKRYGFSHKKYMKKEKEYQKIHISHAGNIVIPILVSDMDISRDGRRIAVSEIYEGLHAYTVQGTITEEGKCEKIRGVSSFMRFHRNGDLLALVQDRSSCLNLWNVDRGEKLASIKDATGSCSISPGGEYLACVSSAGVPHVYRIEITENICAGRRQAFIGECARFDAARHFISPPATVQLMSKRCAPVS
ncbi:hypothetical protein ACFL2P_02495 [Candidatus Moduliflexota bacterium]